MAYIVLARKWRPQTFAEVVGQLSVVRTLQNAIMLDRVAHALLFSGVRGVGKTTLARLIAKALNCLAVERRSRPCNQCASCQAFNEGKADSLHEIDGASNRGIQEIRELKENIRYLPISGKYKIVIIDEVHMLTPEAFNALLKTLEEPPAHVYFVFATTELHKIPVTILSRCQRYELTRVSFAALLDFFRRVAVREEVAIPDSALEMITREADGSVRDGLSLLDQVFSFGGRQVSDDDVRQMLGLVDRLVFERLARALLSSDLAQCLAIFDQCYRAGIDLKRFAGGLLNYFRNLVICAATDQPGKLLDLADRELIALRELAAAHSSETLISCFNLLFKGIEEMNYASRPKLALEMTLVRATRVGQIVSTAEVLARLDQVLPSLSAAPKGETFGPMAAAVVITIAEPQMNVVSAPPPGLQASPAPSVAPEVRPEVSSKVTPKVLPEAMSEASPEAIPEVVPEIRSETWPGVSPAVSLDVPSEAPLRVSPKKSRSCLSANLSSDKVNPDGLDQPPTSGRDLRPDWDGFVAYVRKRKIWLAATLEMAAGMREENGELWLRYDHASDCKLLELTENHRLLTEFVQNYFQQEWTVRLRTSDGDARAMSGEGGLQAERRALAHDPLVRTVVEIFNGDIAEVRTAKV